MLPGQLLVQLRRNPIAFMTNLAQEYGDVAHFKVFSQRVFMFNHPEFIREVLITRQRNLIKGRALQKAKRLLGEGLLTSEGDFHLRQRRLLQPAFHQRRLENYAAVMVDYANRLNGRWQEGATVDMHAEMMRLTLAIVGKTLVNADIEADARDIGQALDTLVQLFDRIMFPLANILEQLPIPATRRLNGALEQLDGIVYRLIEERQREGDLGDLLSMLLSAQDEKGRNMTAVQVRDELLTILLAGHETTANALTWTWYLLSQFPDVAGTLHDELAAVLQGRLPTPSDLAALPYSRMVLSESMRLYPPAWAIGRTAVANCTIGGYLVPAGSAVFISQWVMHHDARYYPEPFRFDPLRWTPEGQAGRPQFAYFPFGAGPRYCIGESFAWTEMILVLATLAQRWQPWLQPKQSVALQPNITLRPKYGMKMVLNRR